MICLIIQRQIREHMKIRMIPYLRLVMFLIRKLFYVQNVWLLLVLGQIQLVHSIKTL